MLIEKLLPHITHISHEIQNKGKHGEKVKGGGKVIRIIDMSHFTCGNTPGNLVYVTIDDSIGEVTAVIPKPFFDEANIENGDIIIVKGELYHLLKETRFISKANSTIIKQRDDEPFRILVQEVHKI